MKTISVQTSGKLYIAGEYAILTPGQTAILKNVPIHMTATVKEAERITLFSDMFDYTTDMTVDKNYVLIQRAIVTLATYLDESLHDLPVFEFGITGKLERDGKKFGIGSGGSVTVLTLKALSVFYELNLSADTIFKPASYTLLKPGDNGSMGDIACIAYDDLVALTSSDHQKVSTWIATEDIKTIFAKDWGYHIEAIKPVLACDFLVGWTKQPSISKDMINSVKSVITKAFLEDTEGNVQICKRTPQTGDKVAVKASLQKVSDLLLGLSSAIYNDKLEALRSAEKGLDVVAKSSDLGGGDCGIAISFPESDSHKLAQCWQKAGIKIPYQERLSDER